MIFAEPATTKFDVRFKVGRVPVRVHPFFWASTIGLSVRPDATTLSVALWLIAVLVSILVHELGHAGAFQHFGWKPRITLYGLGGLASADSRGAGRRLTSRTKILVSAAGPFAGFAFAAIVAVLVLQLGYGVPLVYWTIGSGPPIPNRTLHLLVFDAMTINVLWGLVNLLPVHPLDGGQIALELSRARDPVRGVERSVWLSFFVATAVAIVGLTVLADWFTTLLFGYLAIMSWLVLRRRYRARFESLSPVPWLGRRWSSWRKARRKRSIHLTVVKELRTIDDVDETASDAVVDKVVDDLLRSAVSKGGA